MTRIADSKILNKILPCPYCKEKRWLFARNYENPEYQVDCKCGRFGGLLSWHKTKEQAIKEWNDIITIKMKGGEKPRCANCEHYKPDGTPNVYEGCVCIHPAEEYPLDSVLRMKPDDFCSRFKEKEEENENSI